MSDPVASQIVVVSNPQGLHARPAYLLAELATKFQSKVELIKDGERVDGKSILSILTLGAAEGTEIEVATHGPDADKALQAVVSMIQNGFPEGDAETADSYVE